MSILAGASGAGKTTLLMQEIAAWASGTSLSGAIKWDPSIERIAYIAADRTKEEVVHRAGKLGIPPERMMIYGVQDDLGFDLNWLKVAEIALTKAVDRGFAGKPFQLLLIDPIALFLDGKLNEYKDVAISLLKMGRWAIKNKVTVLATHHVTKQKTDAQFKRVQDRINGSGALQGYSGTQMVLVEGKEDGVGYDTLAVIPHMSPMKVVYLRRGEGGLFESFQQEGEALESSDDGKRIDALVMAFAPGEVMNIKTLQEAGRRLGMGERTTFRRVDEMVKQGRLQRVGKGEYARLERHDGADSQ